MKVDIYSREEMEMRLREGPLEHTAVISFYDPPSSRTPKDYEPLDYGDQCPVLFAVPVHDIDPEILPEYGLTMETFLPEADALAIFIKNAARNGLDMICQCEYGQSRSAGCAAAIREYFHKDGICVFADYRYYPNQLIFNKMLSALEKQKDEKSPAVSQQ